MAVYGYIRVSTNKGQTTENQSQEILAAGYAVTKFFSEDAVSGSVPQFERKAFKELWEACQSGDVCVFSKIDRLGRNAADTLNTVEAFREKGVKVVVLQFGGVDMASSAGKFLTSILAACAEMERDLCIERINAGLVRTKAAGTVLGPPLGIAPDVMKALCLERLAGVTFETLKEKYSIPRATIARNVKEWADRLEEYTEVFNNQASQHKINKEKRVNK